MTEVWERHPIYPHEGSSDGQMRTLDGRILATRPHNRPKGVPAGERYRKADIWIPGENGQPGRRITVLVHQFITECHWGLKSHRRKVARHRYGASPASARWDDLLGWGWPEDNEADKPREVRVAAARTARQAQLIGYPPRQRWWVRAARHVPWPPPRPRTRRKRAGSRPITKPVTKDAL